MNLDCKELRNKLSEEMYGVWYCELNGTTRADIDRIINIFEEFLGGTK